MGDPSGIQVPRSKSRREPRPSFIKAKGQEKKSQSSADWNKCQEILRRMKDRQAAQVRDEQELADWAARLPRYLQERIAEQRANEGIAIQPPLFAEQ